MKYEDIDGGASHRTLNGCKALHDCEIKNQCLRYHRFLYQPLIGFHAYQSCKISAFTEKRYLHFIKITPEVALDNLVRLSEELGLYDYEGE